MDPRTRPPASHRPACSHRDPHSPQMAVGSLQWIRNRSNLQPRACRAACKGTGKHDSSPRSERPAPRWPSRLIPQSQPCSSCAIASAPACLGPSSPWPLGFAVTPSTGKRASFLCRGLGRRPPRGAVVETGSGLYRPQDRLDPRLSQSMRRPVKARGSSSPVKGPDPVGIVSRFPDLRFFDQMVLVPGSHACP